jgi:GR25 family glycosyltransferase involved in LPS biosynthesis
MRNWKTYIISLLNRTDRRSNILSTMDWLDYTFIDAVPGSDINVSKLIKAGVLNESFYDPSGAVNKNIIGCSLSHIKAWVKFKESGESIGLILEDDVVYTPSYNLEELQPDIDKLDWDVIYLGKHEKYITGLAETKMVSRVLYGHGGWGAHAYLINQTSVDKLIAKYQPIKLAVDVFIDHMTDEWNIFTVNQSQFRQAGYDIKREAKPKLDSDTLLNIKHLTGMVVDEIVESIEVSNYSDHKDYIPNRGWIKLNIKK